MQGFANRFTSGSSLTFRRVYLLPLLPCLSSLHAVCSSVKRRCTLREQLTALTLNLQPQKYRAEYYLIANWDWRGSEQHRTRNTVKQVASWTEPFNLGGGRHVSCNRK
jgi:hypothetical protein